eukprot:2422185-Pleurochrysis_carterae.AAC.2
MSTAPVIALFESLGRRKITKNPIYSHHTSISPRPSATFASRLRAPLHSSPDLFQMTRVRLLLLGLLPLDAVVAEPLALCVGALELLALGQHADAHAAVRRLVYQHARARRRSGIADERLRESGHREPQSFLRNFTVGARATFEWKLLLN